MRMFLAVVAMALIGVGAQKSSAQEPTPWPVPAGHTVLTIWPNGAPGTGNATGPEKDIADPKTAITAGRPLVRWTNVSAPTLTLFTPKGTNTGAAVVVFPGGGYSFLAVDLEGTEVCDWLTSKGITCVILKYRVPNTGPYPKSSAALQDAQRAVGIVRAHAVEWKIDPKRIGVIGFSAGAHLAAALSTHYDQRLYPTVDAADQVSCRPDFAMVIYPGYLTDPAKGFAFSPDVPVTSETPPAFIVQAENDPVHVENATAYFLALKGVKVPAELHVYAKGGHGYGLRKTDQPITEWPKLADVWLKTIGMVK
jgi:acetyl esterase/lipase